MRNNGPSTGNVRNPPRKNRMEFSTLTNASLHTLKTPALAVGVFQDGVLSEAADALDQAASGALRAIVKSEFEGKPGSCLPVHAPTGIAATRVILLGLGPQDQYKAATHARAQAAFAAYCAGAGITSAVSTLAAIACPDASVADRARAAARAASTAAYRYDATFSKPRPASKLRSFALHVPRGQATQAREGLRQGGAIGAGMNLARTLGDLPPNVCTPTYLGKTARDLARQFKTLKAEVLDQRKIEALKMGSFLSVARGSAEPPAFIVLRHTPSAQPAGKQAPIVLVGKGITFDAGGISLKPGPGMDEMKFDMCGAASVLGTMRAIAELDLPHEVI